MSSLTFEGGDFWSNSGVTSGGSVVGSQSQLLVRGSFNTGGDSDDWGGGEVDVGDTFRGRDWSDRGSGSRSDSDFRNWTHSSVDSTFNGGGDGSHWGDFSDWADGGVDGTFNGGGDGGHLDCGRNWGGFSFGTDGGVDGFNTVDGFGDDGQGSWQGGFSTLVV